MRFKGGGRLTGAMERMIERDREAFREECEGETEEEREEREWLEDKEYGEARAEEWALDMDEKEEK